MALSIPKTFPLLFALAGRVVGGLTWVVVCFLFALIAQKSSSWRFQNILAAFHLRLKTAILNLVQHLTKCIWS